ncbi:MAG: hypothetical protein JO247_11075 [Chloroflexi bacterium]|nr:hypothetical protein [Chloroflexota bacterium]
MRPVMRQRQLGQQARQRRTWALALAESQQAPAHETARAGRARHTGNQPALSQR